MFWKGGKEGQNGVGIAVQEEWVGSVVRAMRASERLMAIELALEGELVTFVSVYAPQVSQPQEEKDEFYDEIYRFIGKLKRKYVVLGDMNGHVGRDVDGFEGVHGGNGFGDRNAEGEAILEFATCFDLVVVNTFFTKETQNLVTYESGGLSSVVDYVLTRKNDMKNVKDVKVIPGEECVSQHKLVVMNMRIKRSTKKKARGTRGRLKTWRLRSATEKEEFKCEVEKIVVHGESAQERWNSLEHGLKNAAEKVCGRSKGGKKCGGGTNRLRKLLRGKKRGMRNGGKTGVKRIWRRIRC